MDNGFKFCTSNTCICLLMYVPPLLCVRLCDVGAVLSLLFLFVKGFCGGSVAGAACNVLD